MKKTEELVEDILSDLDSFRNIEAGQVPDIGLYMDQVTSFMEENLSREKRYPDDKVLTKTMINNYTKNRLLPPSDKKKYSRDHVLILLFIYFYKNLLSFRDIEVLFGPLTENHFRTTTDIPLSEIYDRLFNVAQEQMESLKEDIRSKMETAGTVFEDCHSDDEEYLKMFAMINALVSDIYVKKKVIENLIDRLAEEIEKKDPSKKKR